MADLSEIAKLPPETQEALREMAEAGMTPDQIYELQIRTLYPDLAHYLEHPELGQILRQAAREGWDELRLISAVRGSDWWQTTVPSIREFDLLKATDPQRLLQERIAPLQEKLYRYAVEIGASIPNMQTLYDLAEKAVRLGWSDQDLRGAVADYWTYKPEGLRGTTAALQDEMKKIASAYIVPVSDRTLEYWIQSTLEGRTDMSNFVQYMQEQAQSLFPHLKDAYAKGMTTAQYVAPYAEIAGRELGLDPNQIDWFDPKWQKALTRVDPETGERGAMSLADWMTEIRSNPNYGWSSTVGAKELGTEFATALGQRWGRVA